MSKYVSGLFGANNGFTIRTQNPITGENEITAIFDQNIKFVKPIIPVLSFGGYNSEIQTQLLALLDTYNDEKRYFGFGISPFQLDDVVEAANASHVFYAGNVLGDRDELMRIGGDGSVNVVGFLSKASGAFNIQHPDPAKAADYRLIHSFVEAPTRGDNIYRYVVKTAKKTATVALPSYFPFLNENPQVWVCPEDTLGTAYGKISDDLLTITITASAEGTYNVLVIATRKDEMSIKGFDEKYGSVECKVEDGSVMNSKRIQ